MHLVEEWVQKHLRSENRLLSIISRVNYQELSVFWEVINEIPYAVIKGEPLSLLAYNKFGFRGLGDVDILIDRKSIPKMKKILKACGFEAISRDEKKTNFSRVFCLASSHQMVPYVKELQSKKGCHVELDINFDLFWGEYSGKRIDVNQFLEDASEMEIYGHKLQTLPPIKALLQVCLHHYKEMNSIYHLVKHNTINLPMFQDVYYLIKNNLDTITVSTIYHLSNEYKITPYVFYVIYYTQLIFKDPCLNQFLEALKTEEGEKLLDYYGLTEQERKKWQTDFFTRLKTDKKLNLIKNNLTEADIHKLRINNKVFRGY